MTQTVQDSSLLILSRDPIGPNLYVASENERRHTSKILVRFPELATARVHALIGSGLRYIVSYASVQAVFLRFSVDKNPASGMRVKNQGSVGQVLILHSATIVRAD
jgi:hypothetical protein